MRTIILLTISNVFMTFAWYGHLRFRESPLWIAIVVSWMIAFAEYCFQVPANRIGSYQFSTAQLKTIQEVIAETNTAAKASNPDPNQWVGWGDRTVDEMAHAWVNVTYISDDDYNAWAAKHKPKKPAFGLGALLGNNQ